MNILVAYDGSDSAHRALDQAATLAERGANVSVVSVAEPLPQFGRASAMLLSEEDEERRENLADAKAVLASRGIGAHTVERRGEAASMILDEAQREHADIIVMGTRGHRAPKRWLLGSVSARVMHRAPCDVVIVR
jgi:nucleotide-binding universal stress UspA family protein